MTKQEQDFRTGYAAGATGRPSPVGMSESYKVGWDAGHGDAERTTTSEPGSPAARVREEVKGLFA